MAGENAMKPAVKFSLLVFGPVLIVFLLPAIFLVPQSVLFTLTAVFDPTLGFSHALPFILWAAAPFTAAALLFLLGFSLYPSYRGNPASRPVWIMIWAFFSAAFFLAAWFGMTLLTSIGASDIPTYVFLRSTAAMAAFLTLLGQLGVIPWLYLVSKIMKS
jgi:hypothetical protein